jgi:hypothetical protein
LPGISTLPFPVHISLGDGLPLKWEHIHTLTGALSKRIIKSSVLQRMISMLSTVVDLSEITLYEF